MSLEWFGPRASVEGRAWGGNLEVIDFQLRASRYVGAPSSYAGAVLFFETSEELPSSSYVSRVLTGLGERGLLEQFVAVLVGRPKAWSFETPNDVPAKRRYVHEQQQAVRSVVSEYNPDAVLVFNLDIGHTDPQLVVPHGGPVRVDGVAWRGPSPSSTDKSASQRPRHRSEVVHRHRPDRSASKSAAILPMPSVGAAAASTRQMGKASNGPRASGATSWMPR